MASRKSEAGVSRPKQKPPMQIGITQLVLAGVAIVAVIVLALLLFGGRGKKSAAPRLRTVAANEESGARAPRRGSARAARTRNVKRDEERAKLREERLKRRQEARSSGGRTSRSPSGGFTSGGSARAASAPNELRAILTDNTGARTALVGERRLRAGDDIEGRRIVEVSGDGIKVEYRQNTYTVRVGEKVY